MPSKRELVNAILVLKEECSENLLCDDCTFCADDGMCMIQSHAPTYWSVGMMKEVGNDEG